MRRRTDYVELHLHTAFSFLDGASMPEEMIARASDLSYQALAITDHDGLHGAMEFTNLAQAAGITPIIGAELTLSDNSHLTLLAETRTGYANLCRLITALHHGNPPNVGERGSENWGQEKGANSRAPHLAPRASLPAPHSPLLATHAAGLILLTGCRQGQLARLVDDGHFQEAEALLRRYVEWFGAANVVVELQQNLVHGDTRRIARLVQLAEHLGLRYAATGNVHYHRRERHRLQDVLVAIRHRTTLDGSHRERRANAEFYLRSAAEMAELFTRYPQALTTTVQIAERCAGFNLARDLNYVFPTYPTDPGETPDDRLATICWAAFTERYASNDEAAKARLNEELTLIARHKLAGFFLLYRDLLELARDVAAEIRGVNTARARGNLPPGRGRGSSVSSVVCYLIGLSPVDPLAHNLFLGRFLNDTISSVPDIDLDFPRDIRERLIERVYEVYGPDRAALVCAFSTYKLRSAVRDIGKALGLPLPDLDRIAKLSEPHSARDLDQELGRIPEYAARKDAPPWKHLVELAEQLAGFPRHVTQHVGGMIVSSEPLNALVPIQPAAMAGRYICQWDKDSCEDARFVKIDFLALGMLSLVEECLERIVASGYPPVDLSRINFADNAVFQMIQRGDTIGVFQIESRAQIQTLLHTKPQSLEDLIVQVAIIRPGPIIGGAVTPYVQRRTQPDFQPTYDHPLLEPVLRETLGVVLYQEQVVQVAMALAGFTAGQADQLRRAMSRKRSREAMAHLWHEFRAGAQAKNIDPETTRTVFRKLMGFAEYGFPKSHAAAFALLAYQSCWLKHYYPAEFLCALLNNQPMGFYAPHVLVNDGKRHGLRILSPDVNVSAATCAVEERRTVRIGLGYVAGLSEDAAQGIVAERKCSGPFRSLADFVRRVPLRSEAVENLIAVGAFDPFGLSRREALWQLGLFIPARGFGSKSKPKSGRPIKAAGKQIPLALPVEQDMVELPPTRPWEQMVADYDTLGLSPRYHPLGLLRPRLPNSIVATADLEKLPDGTLVRLAGLVVCRQRPGTAKGITFLLLEDEFGLANVIVYPDLYEEQRLLVRGEPFLLIEGRLQRRGQTINLLAQRLHRLEEANQILPPATKAEAHMIAIAAGHTSRDDEPANPPLHQTDNLRTLSPASHNYR